MTLYTQGYTVGGEGHINTPVIIHIVYLVDATLVFNTCCGGRSPKPGAAVTNAHKREPNASLSVVGLQLLATYTSCWAASQQQQVTLKGEIGGQPRNHCPVGLLWAKLRKSEHFHLLCVAGFSLPTCSQTVFSVSLSGAAPGR